MSRSIFFRFPEGSALDRADKRVSTPLFTLEPGVAVETLWSVPAWWFGNPFTALGTVPVVLAALVDATTPASSSSSFAIFAALSLFASLTLWLKYLALMRREPDMYPFGYLYSLGFRSKGLALFFFGLGHAVAGLTKFGCSRRAHEAVNYYSTCYYCSLALCGFFKELFRRERPCAEQSVLAKRLNRVQRFFPDMQSFLAAHSTYASFPSGDATGGAVFAVVSSMFFPLAWSPWVLLSLCMSGRLFFHAHHLLDVLVGAGIAATVCHVIQRCLMGPAATWATMSIIQFCSAVVFVLIYKDKKRG
jgi:membrane-associated phospholipid phosphatase